MKISVLLTSLLFGIGVAFAQNQNNPPVVDASKLSSTLTEGDEVQITFSDFVSDADGDMLSYTINSQPNNGTVVLNSDSNEITYKHNGNQVDSDSFSFTVSDGNGGIVNATYEFIIGLENDAPVLVASPIQVSEGSKTSIILLATDEESDELEFIVTKNPTYGTVYINSQRELTYTHNGTESLEDELSIQVKETKINGKTGNTVSFSITIEPVNDAPTASNIALEVEEGGIVIGTISSTDAENSSLRYSVSATPAHGEVSVDSQGQLTYTHDGGTSLEDAFKYEVSDGTLSNEYDVIVTVSPVNDAPVGAADTYFVLGTNVLQVGPSIGVLANDQDEEGDELTVEIKELPTLGVLELLNDGSFSFEANSEGFEVDTFSYIIIDAAGNSSDPVTVTIEGSELRPVADSYNLLENETLVIDADNGILINDVEGNNLPFTAVLVSAPKFGQFELASDGSFSYQHDGSENYKDSFSYKIKNTNDVESKSVRVYLEIENVNDAPTARKTVISINEGATFSFIPNYEDLDNQLSDLTFNLYPTQDGSSADIISSDVGVLTLNSDGKVIYSHNGSENLTDQFYYSVSDGNLTSEIVELVINMTPVNDAPVAIGTSEAVVVDEGATITSVLQATDAEGDALAFEAVTNPSNGTLVLNEDGTFSYKNNGIQLGSPTFTDSFSYKVSDGELYSKTQTVAIEITSVNDAPEPETGVNFTVNENDFITFDLSNRFNDEEGDSFTVTITTAPNFGSLEVNQDGNFTYTNDGSEEVKDQFVVTATDINSASTSMTVSLNISPINDAPIVVPQTDLVVDQLDELDFSIEVTDAEGDEITLSVTNPSRGALTFNDDGTYTFKDATVDQTSDPAETFEPVIFQVTATDSSGLSSDPVNFSIEVKNVNENLPFIALSSVNNSTNVIEGGTVTLTASLVSPKFYSQKRDLPSNLIDSYTYLGSYEGHVYYVYEGSNYNMEYSAAKTKALEAGGYPVVFETANEFNFVINSDYHQSLNYTQYWTGINYDFNAKEFSWINGSELSYLNWSNFDETITEEGYAANRNVLFNSSGWSNQNANSTARLIVEFDKELIAETDIVFNLTTTGSASDPADFNSLTNQYTVKAGTSNIEIPIITIDDDQDEPTEVINILISKEDNATTYNVLKSKQELSLDLVDNESTDVTFNIIQGKSIFNEDEGIVTIEATLDNAKPFDTSLQLKLGGNATTNEDYVINDFGYITTLLSSIGYNPTGLVMDSSGNIYFVDNYTSLNKFNLSTSEKTQLNNTNNCCGYTTDPEPLSQVRFRNIRDMDIDDQNNIYMIDENYIRKLNINSSLVSFVAGANQWQASTDGIGAAAKFNNLQSIAVHPDGSVIYILENNKLRMIEFTDNGAEVTSIAGNGQWDYADGSGSSVRFQGAQALDVAPNGDVYIAEYGGVRKYSNGIVSTVLRSNYNISGIDASIPGILYLSTYEHQLFSYEIATESLNSLIDSRSNGATKDGTFATGKVYRPLHLLATSSELFFIEQGNNNLRKADFINKLRIPKNQKTGTYSFLIKDDNFYESSETVQVRVLAAESINFDATTGIDFSIESDDEAPEIQISSSKKQLAEDGSEATITIQLGNAVEAGSKTDLDNGLQSEYISLGEFNGSKYYLSNEFRNWTEAADTAKRLGGYLVTVNSEAENQFITSGKNNNNVNSIWIGYSDAANEGQFEWSNGSDATFTNWQGGEPNNAGDEDYVELYGSGQWNDSGDSNRRYVIEFSGTKSSQDTTIAFEITGTDGFESDFSVPSLRSVTIPAGSNKASFTISSTIDDESESLESLTIALTEVTSANGSNGVISSSNNKVTVSILDDDAPELSWSATSSSANEDGSTVIELLASTLLAKQTDSELVLSLNTTGSDTAEFNKDYEIPELKKVTTFSGNGKASYIDGAASAASFNKNHKIVVYKENNFLVADAENNVIRLVDAKGNVSTYIGNGNWGHDPIQSSNYRTDVSLARPTDIAVSTEGDIYIAESGRNRISKVTSEGVYSVIAGNGEGQRIDGIGVSNTSFRNPRALALDSKGNLFVIAENVIRKIQLSSGEVSTFAGNGDWNYTDGNGEDARFENPRDIIIDSNDDLYIAENNRIRKVTPNADVTTYTGQWWDDKDGSLDSARYKNPSAIAFDKDKNILVFDEETLKLKIIYRFGDKKGLVETLIGNGSGYVDGSFTLAKFRSSKGLATTSSGIYISDSENNVIRKIATIPSIVIPAGSTTGTITIKALDDQIFEQQNESISISVVSTVNVSESSQFEGLNLEIVDNDQQPILNVSAVNDFIDEEGGVGYFKAYLTDQYSTDRVDMDSAEKSKFYYLGEFGGSTYYASKNNEWLTYNQAVAKASSLGGSLAVITSVNENDFIVNKIYELDPNYDRDNNRWLNHWIGYRFNDSSSSWEWSNSYPTSFENWQNTPYNAQQNQGVMLHEYGKWMNTNWNDTRMFVVEFATGVSDIETTATVNFDTSSADASDYATNIISNTISIPKGANSALIEVTGLSDDSDEAIETIEVSITEVTNAILNEALASAKMAIKDDELPELSLSLDKETIGEAEDQLVMTASIKNAKLEPVSIDLDFGTGDGAALYEVDFESPSVNSVSTLAGAGYSGYLDGDAASAEFGNDIRGLVVDSKGNTYVADSNNNVIRKIDSKGVVSTFAGNRNWNNGMKEGFRTEIDLNWPRALALDANDQLYIAENHLISMIDLDGQYRIVAGGNNWGSRDGAALEAQFGNINDMAFNAKGDLFVMDDARLRLVAISSDAAVVTLSGRENECGYQDGFGDDAKFSCYDQKSIAVDSKGFVYIADGHSNRIRRYDPDTTEVKTIAGSYNWGSSDGYGPNASFKNPSGLTIDSNDHIYVSDVDGNSIRKIVSDDNGYKVTTIAGSDESGLINGSASSARFSRPTYIDISSGALHIVDLGNVTIRKMNTSPRLVIPAGSLSTTFSIVSIDDIDYELEESISIIPKTITGGTYSPSVALNATLVSDDQIPIVTIQSNIKVLNENEGVLPIEIKLIDNEGSDSIWENDDLPEANKNSFIFLGTYNGHKYYQSNDQVTFATAREIAQSLGGDLLVIDDQDENNFISNYIQNGSWIGITDEEQEGVWKPIYGDTAYTNFDQNNNEPNGGTNENHAITWGQRWYDVYKGNQSSYIIEFGPTKSSGIDTNVTLAISGTAENGVDFTSDSLEVTIPAGSNKVAFNLQGIDDEIDEAIETIQVQISAVGENQATIAANQNTIDIIISDDEQPNLTFSTSIDKIAENGGEATISVELSNEKVNPTQINFDFGGEATLINDYTSVNLFEVNTFSGAGDSRGYMDGVASLAKFQDVKRIEAYDASSFVFADASNRVIRKLNADGSVETLIGNGSYGNQDGLALEIGLNEPQGLDVDAQGNIYFVTQNNKVRMYNKATGRVTTLAGSGSWGYMDGVGSNATFRNPQDVAVGNGVLYVADENNTIRVIAQNDQGNYEVSSLTDAITNDNQINEGDLSVASVGMPNALEFDAKENKLYIISNGFYLVVIDFNTNQLKKFKLTEWDEWGAIQDLTLGADGAIYFTNQNNHTLNKFEFKPLPDSYGTPTSWSLVTDYNGSSHNFYTDTQDANLIKTIISVDQRTWTQIWDGAINQGTQYGSNNDDQFLDTNPNSWIGFEEFTSGTYEVTINLSNKSYAINNVSSELSSKGYAVTQIAGSGSNGYVDAIGTEAEFYYPISLEASNNFVLVFDYNNFVFRKVNVMPSIEVPAGVKNGSLTLKAYKDQYFEGEEVVELVVSSTINGIASNPVLDPITIVDATGLRLVEGAPFEGVENGKVSWGDYDRDGDMDLALMGQGNGGTITNIYKNTNGVFTNTNQNFTKFIGGDIEFVDVDQDGWLDVAVSGNSSEGRKSELYINRGALAPSAPYFELMTSYQVEGLSQSDMEWGDLDNDGDADLIIAGINDNNEYRTLYYTNLGNYKFLLEPLFQAQGLINPQISIVDIDADGDNDLFVNGKNQNNNISYESYFNSYFDSNTNFDRQVYKNGKILYLDIDSNGTVDYYAMGADDNSRLRQSSNLNISLQSLSNPDFDFADYNNDGFNDVILTGEDENGIPTTKLYTTVLKNSAEYRLFDTGIDIIGLREGTVDWIDYDFDGDLDLFMTGLGNDGTPKSVLYEAINYENINTPPSKIDNLKYTHDGNGLVTLNWDKPEDNVSNEFRYAVRIGTTSGGSEVRYANSNLENGNTLINIPSLSTLNELQVILEPGTYYVAVQAIDGGNRGGVFSDELTFTIDYDWKRLNLGGVIDRRLRPAENSKLNFVDVDGDGDMDLVSNQVGMNNVSQESINIYKFENEVFVPIQSYYGGNTNYGLGDLNNDGAIDFVYAQEESNGVRINFALNNSIENQQVSDTTSVIDAGLFSTYNLMIENNLISSLFNPQIVIKDLNNDGLVEVILAGASSLIESEAVASIYVLNINLDQEAIGYNNFSFSAQKLIESNETLNQLSFISFDMGDVDNDNDYDLIISGYGFNGYATILFENTGNLEGELFAETSNNFLSVKNGTASFVDVDGDGKLDVLFSGQSAEGDIFKAYKNTGNINNFAALDLGLPALRNSKVDFGDFNSDGYYDILYSGVIQGEGEVTKLATFNPSSGRFETSDFDVSMYLNASVGFGDFDGDDDLDFVLTGKDATNDTNTYLTDVFINVRGEVTTGKSSKAAGLSAKSSLSSPDQLTVQRKRIADNLFEVTISWNEGQNRTGNPNSALTYSLRVGTQEGSEDVLASGADLSGVRKTATRGNAENNLQWKLNLKPGDYHVAVQSVDASYIGSAFSTSKGFTVVNSYKLGDANGDDVVNVLDLTTNIDYILGKNPAIFINEVADVNFDEVINVTDISGIVDIILNGTSDTAKGDVLAKGASLNYYSNQAVGTARLISDGMEVRLESDRPVTALQFSVAEEVDLILSEDLAEFQIVNFTKNGSTTYMIYSMENKNILEATSHIFRLNSSDPLPMKINQIAGATTQAGTLDFEFEDEYYLNTLASANDLMIYPNPARDEVQLLLGTSRLSSTVELNVYNLSGVKVIEVERLDTSNKQHLNVGNLPTGIYIVEAIYYNEKGQRSIKKSKLIKDSK